jgi:acyl-CoA synthetase (AMP-forming)/AMP-acid ligase II
MGDIGHVDDEGYLYLTDRRDYVIISGGVNIYPQESENVLEAHPKVADVAVFGVPNESSAKRSRPWSCRRIPRRPDRSSRGN